MEFLPDPHRLDLKKHGEDLGSGIDSQSSHDMFKVSFDRVFRNVERIRHLFVCGSGHEQLQDVHMSFRQEKALFEFRQVYLAMYGNFFDQDHNMGRFFG